MKEFNHDVFGVIRRETYGYWRRKESLNFWGIERDIYIVIVADEEPIFEKSQEKAYTEFLIDKEKFISETQISIYKYYSSILKELREQFEFNKDDFVPIIDNEYELSKLVKPTEIIFKETYGEDKTKFGILFDCTWDSSHGLAVVFENGKLKEIGEQDIIL